MSYDPSNIFGKILRGEIPAHKVYEDDLALVMMDIFPQSRGHTLIVPKAPSRNLLDADPAALSAVMPLVQKVARAVKQVTRADGVRLAQFNEAPAGQTVFHLHFHVIPIYEGVPLGAHGGGKAEDAETERHTGNGRETRPAAFAGRHDGEIGHVRAGRQFDDQGCKREGGDRRERQGECQLFQNTAPHCDCFGDNLPRTGAARNEGCAPGT